MREADIRKLYRLAEEARKNAYAPYSGFAVGAALLAESGKIYTGCNVENASYGATCCAERNAIFHAAAEGERSLIAIAIAGGPKDGETQNCPPCGICRQVMLEFAKDPAEFQIILKGEKEEEPDIYTLEELLPHHFEL